MAACAGTGAERTTAPVPSSVSVSSPNFMVAAYTFGSPSRYGRSRVARPTRRTSKPVANGSSVPPCPTRRTGRARRAMATTSCDVMPAGLSTRTNPSIVGILIARRRIDGRRVVAQTREERFDARRVLGRFVAAELDFRREAQAQRAGDERAQVRGEARQALERRAVRGLVA